VIGSPQHVIEFSFGVVPLRRIDQGIELLLIHHRKGHWTLPKGHIEAGETPWEAAARELTEETGFSVDSWLPVPPTQETYPHGDHQKVCTYFPARVSGELHLLLAEVQGAHWYTPTIALQKLTYPETRNALHKALAWLSTDV